MTMDKTMLYLRANFKTAMWKPRFDDNEKPGNLACKFSSIV